MKTSVLRELKSFIKRLCLIMRLKRIYASDSRYKLRNLRGLSKESKDNSDAEIMLIMHALEKGLSFSKKKKGFGKEKSATLVEKLNKHISRYGIDRQVVVATNVLQSYFLDSYSVSDADVRKQIEDYLDEHKDLLADSVGGTKDVRRPDGNPSYDDIKRFFISRTSVRTYSDIPLSKEEIDKAIEVAKLTPSACNRQASRIYVVKDKQKMNKVFENQLGDQGWCNGADTLFVVTSVASYFGSLYEREEPYIDGGMFAMNLVLGLHAQGIASCCKMYIRDPKIDKTVRSILSIPENEIPIILVLAGHYPNHITQSPISIRNAVSYELQ